MLFDWEMGSLELDRERDREKLERTSGLEWMSYVLKMSLHLSCSSESRFFSALSLGHANMLCSQRLIGYAPRESHISCERLGFMAYLVSCSKLRSSSHLCHIESSSG